MNQNNLTENFIDMMVRWERAGIVKESIFEVSRGELAVLTYLMDGHNGVSAREVSECFHVNTSRVAAILNSLSKKNFIERKVDEKDKRRIQIFLTTEGQYYIKQKRQDVLTHAQKIVDKMGEEDTKELIRLVKKMLCILPEVQ